MALKPLEKDLSPAVCCGPGLVESPAWDKSRATRAEGMTKARKGVRHPP